MKKLLSLLLLLSLAAQAQESSPLDNKKNEFRVDLLSALVWQKASLSYERFFGGNFSTGFNVNFSDSNQLNEDFDNGYRNNVPKFEFNPYVRYQLSKGKKSFYFAEAFASYNSGDFKEIVRMTDGSGNGYYTTEKSKYNDFGLGGGLGYKMYIKDAFVIEFLAGFGSNLTNRDKSPDVISRVGFNLGYRF
ncbi:DUF3575 domain-containing protein [Flavobacterium sp. J49]|uniref:DUF3575 domain-containing protein n=1 Tax=Flavobacterium sp. J49 TaxID=2718534 RepID=UPI00159432EA|nr:DUF3575 domain-containing protein [Flavobacterium sp. J49]MBF6642357.1 DUF3575 domain-containing protein [Flavobacterium sp. J49]NIC03603.1 DUF3575 domain-containing protein [Flavobacterium sp. J49]